MYGLILFIIIQFSRRKTFPDQYIKTFAPEITFTATLKDDIEISMSVKQTRPHAPFITPEFSKFCLCHGVLFSEPNPVLSHSIENIFVALQLHKI
jgi:hypothetical protein